MKRCRQIMDYMWTHPDAIIRYYPSEMILNVHSDASYLSCSDAKSRAAGVFFLGSVTQDKLFLGSVTQDKQPIILNAQRRDQDFLFSVSPWL